MRYYSIILCVFIVAIAAIVYFTATNREVTATDRNVPGATTGPGRTSLQE
jgi:hypothetical protein